MRFSNNLLKRSYCAAVAISADQFVFFGGDGFLTNSNNGCIVDTKNMSIKKIMGKDKDFPIRCYT